MSHFEHHAIPTRSSEQTATFPGGRFIFGIGIPCRCVHRPMEACARFVEGCCALCVSADLRQ